MKRLFASLAEKHLSVFESILFDPKDPSSLTQIITDQEVLSKHNTDWTKAYKGNSKVLLRPKTIDSLQEIVRYCYKERVPLVTQGGNTSLVGGAIPINDEVILSTSSLSRIEGFNENMKSLTCEAGVIMETGDNFVAKYGYQLPYDLSSRGTCTIGGNIATNAGGTHFIRFGPLRSYVLGLEAITGTGQKISSMKGVRKDNTGPDLKQVFIGAEGIYGIITRLNILCVPLPLETKSYLVSIKNSFDEVVKVRDQFMRAFGSQINAIEYWDATCMEAFKRKKAEFPFSDSDGKFFLLLQVYSNRSMSTLEETEQEFFNSIESGLQNGSLDVIVSSNKSSENQLWEIRHGLSDSFSHYSPDLRALKHDLSMDIHDFESFTRFVKEDIRAPEIKVVGCFGHCGDGNIHVNVLVDANSPLERQKEIREAVFQEVIKKGGSVSAEHGMGQTKSKYFGKLNLPEMVEYHKEIKRIFDPHSILNPQKVLSL